MCVSDEQKGRKMVQKSVKRNRLEREIEDSSASLILQIWRWTDNKIIIRRHIGKQNLVSSKNFTLRKVPRTTAIIYSFGKILLNEIEILFYLEEVLHIW